MGTWKTGGGIYRFLPLLPCTGYRLHQQCFPNVLGESTAIGARITLAQEVPHTSTDRPSLGLSSSSRPSICPVGTHCRARGTNLEGSSLFFLACDDDGPSTEKRSTTRHVPQKKSPVKLTSTTTTTTNSYIAHVLRYLEPSAAPSPINHPRSDESCSSFPSLIGPELDRPSIPLPSTRNLAPLQCMASCSP